MTRQFAQELLSTFSTSLGEVALQPSTGGTFVVEIYFRDPNNPASSPSSSPSGNPAIQNRVLWDRKVDGGFPETKELKRRVRDTIEPGRDLGHVDRHYPSSSSSSSSKPKTDQATEQTRVSGVGQSAAEDENALGLHTQPEIIGGPACSNNTPGTESARTNAATQQECEDCK